jgi:hypothetical protein
MPALSRSFGMPEFYPRPFPFFGRPPVVEEEFDPLYRPFPWFGPVFPHRHFWGPHHGFHG